MPRRRTRARDMPSARNVDDIARLERDARDEMTLAERAGIAVTNAVGTGWCAGVHLLAIAGWIAWNSVAARPLRVDPFPFGLLTMWVSMEGVLLAILVLITQNRMSRQSDRRDHLDLQVDLLAEQEMTMVLRLLNRIAGRLDVRGNPHEQAETARLMQETDIHELMNELRRRFR